MKIQMETGIKGLDDILNGGVPKGNSILVEGAPGTGKTTLGIQFLVNGALRGEKGIYITFEEMPSQIYSNMLNFGWDLKALEQKGLVKVLAISPSVLCHEMKTPLGLFEELIHSIDCKRIVVDSISMFRQLEDDETERRRTIYQFRNILNKFHLTSFLLSEQSDQHMMNNCEHFVLDGVIRLTFEEKFQEYKERTIEVLKMRGTKILEGKHTYRFTEEGIYVLTAYLSAKNLGHNNNTIIIPTGIHKIDDVLGGGLQKGYTYLIETDSIAQYDWLITSINSNRIKHGEKFIGFLSNDDTPDELFRKYELFDVNLQECVVNGNGMFVEMFNRKMPDEIKPMVIDASKMDLYEYSVYLLEIDRQISEDIEKGESWFCFFEMNSLVDKWGNDFVTEVYKDITAIKKRQRMTSIILCNIEKVNTDMRAMLEYSSHGIIRTWSNGMYQYLQIKKTPLGVNSPPFIVETLPNKPYFRLL